MFPILSLSDLVIIQLCYALVTPHPTPGKHGALDILKEQMKKMPHILGEGLKSKPLPKVSRSHPATGQITGSYRSGRTTLLVEHQMLQCQHMKSGTILKTMCAVLGSSPTKQTPG